MPNLVGMTHRT